MYNLLIYILTCIYKKAMYLYKYFLFFYYYLTSYDKLKLYKNNDKITLTNLNLKNNEQLIFKIKNKKYSLIKKNYNEVIDIINDLYKLEYTNNIFINRIIMIKNIEYNSKIEYSDDEILTFILMYYGPYHNLYDNNYKIKLEDIKDDQNNILNISKLNYIDNNFEDIELNGNQFLK